jgi:hypothetical protein
MGRVMVVVTVSGPILVHADDGVLLMSNFKDSQEIHDILVNRSAEFERANMTMKLSYPFPSEDGLNAH